MEYSTKKFDQSEGLLMTDLKNKKALLPAGIYIVEPKEAYVTSDKD